MFVMSLVFQMNARVVGLRCTLFGMIVVSDFMPRRCQPCMLVSDGEL